MRNNHAISVITCNCTNTGWSLHDHPCDRWVAAHYHRIWTRNNQFKKVNLPIKYSLVVGRTLTAMHFPQFSLWKSSLCLVDGDPGCSLFAVCGSCLYYH